MADILRIAHCSDIHLDGDGHQAGAGGDARESYRRAFARALAEMRAHRPDAMLLAFHRLGSREPPSRVLELLRHPLAVGEIRTAILAGAGAPLRREFATAWEYLAWAERNGHVTPAGR